MRLSKMLKLAMGGLFAAATTFAAHDAQSGGPGGPAAPRGGALQSVWAGLGTAAGAGGALYADLADRTGGRGRCLLDRRRNQQTLSLPSASGRHAQPWLAREDILRFEEIRRLAKLFVERYGVRTIRITGGDTATLTEITDAERSALGSWIAAGSRTN